MRIDEIETRKGEIRDILTSGAEFDVDALTEEVRALDAEKKEIEERTAKEAELRSAVAPAVIAAIKETKKEEERNFMENIITRNSPEYVNAFAEYIKSGDDKQCRALLSENASGTVAVPEMVENTVRTAWNEEGIMSRVKKSFIKGNLKIGFEREAGAAVVHTEGGDAITEEQLTLGIVTLVPSSVKKLVKISDEAMELSAPAFLDYIYREISYQIAKKAADLLVAAIVASPATSTATAPAVPAVKETAIALGTVAKAISELSDEAANPVIIMNKATYAAFKAVQYGASYAVDPFEGLTVLYNNSLKSFSAASTDDTYAIVGDLNGAQANFPNGDEITFHFDENSLAEADLVKIVGREFVGLGVVAPNWFVKITK